MDETRKRNRCGEKWAHPELVDDNAARMEDVMVLYDGVEDNTDANALHAKQEAMDQGVFEALKAGEEFGAWSKAGDWAEYYTEHGCPEEPDAPPVKIVVRSPKNLKADERLPLVFILSSGGLTAGGGAYSGAALGGFVPTMIPSDMRVIVMSCTYRLAPASPYPAAINDLHAAYLWMAEHAEDLKIDTDKIVFTGTSSGGGLCFSLAFRLKSYDWCGLPIPRGLIPLSPVLDDIAFTDSFALSFYNEETGKIENWDSTAVIRNMKCWLGDRFGDITLKPEAIPSRAKLCDIEGGFPPVWFAVGAEMEPSRDTILYLASLLYQAGVYCDLHVWGGGTHITGGLGDSDLARRINAVKYGSLKDAITYDFRRPWLREK